MKAHLISDFLQNGIRTCLRLAPPLSGNIVLEAKSNKLYMHSTSDLSRCSILIPGDISGECFFAISTEALKNALKGHEEVDLTYDKTLLHIKNKKYSTSLSTETAVPLDEIQVEDGQKWKLNVEQAKWLKNAINLTGLKPPNPSMISFMPISVRLTDKFAFVCCYDAQHMAFIIDKKIQGDLDFILPSTTLTAVLDVFVDKLDFIIIVTKSSLIVKNKIINVVLALPEIEKSIDTDAVFQKAKESIKIDGNAIEVSKQQIIGFMDNARSVASKERPELCVNTVPGKMQLKVATTNGVSEISLKASVTKKLSFKVDFEFVDEALRKCSDTIPFKLIEDSFLSFKVKENSYLLVALNQDE